MCERSRERYKEPPQNTMLSEFSKSSQFLSCHDTQTVNIILHQQQHLDGQNNLKKTNLKDIENHSATNQIACASANDDNSCLPPSKTISNHPTSTTCSTKERCEEEELQENNKEALGEKAIEANKYFQ